LVGEFSWQGSFVPSTQEAFWGYSQHLWQISQPLNHAFTSIATLEKTYPPRLAAKRKKVHNMHQNQQRQHAFWIIAFCLSALLGLVFWQATLHIAPLQSGSSSPIYEAQDGFQEQLEGYREGHLGYLWPLVLLRESTLMFLAEQYRLLPQLEQLDPRNHPAKILTLLEEQIPTAQREEFDTLRDLIMQLPSRNQWNDWLHRDVQEHELHFFYYEIARCLRQLGLEELFRKPYSRLKPPTVS
ncbi:MAG: hypothetical protein AAGJ35_10130, partial [Myxococcota bacterium]